MSSVNASLSPALLSGGGNINNSLSPAAAGGRRRRSGRKVSAKTIRRTLRRLGMKPKGRVVLKGGAEGEEAAPAEASMEGARRRRGTRRGRKSRRSLFGLKY